jgi:hypothetical protein
VRSPTSLYIFGLEGQVPEIKIKGETVDISTIAEYAWYEWVKFRDTAAKFPVSKIQLGRDLGAAIDIGPAMMRKILKQNGSVMYRSSLRPLTQDEIQSPTEKKECEEFDIAIEKKFGPAMNKDYFQDDPDYAHFSLQLMTSMKMMKSLPPKCQTLMISRRSMMLIHMTNMLEPM